MTSDRTRRQARHRARSHPHPPHSPPAFPTDDLSEVVVTAQRHTLIGQVESSSQGTVTRAQLETRPVLRTGELLETVPGLVVTQHSGDGKANQYFLRGFNLDHGTDLATSVDGIPVNMHTHGHGQGYTDINFVIPELLDRIEYKKGTYYADEGNFSAAGAVDLKYRRNLDDTLLSLTVGEDSYHARTARGLDGGRRRRSAVRPRLRRHRRTVGARRGPAPRECAREVFARRSAATAIRLTASAYDGDWNSTDQIPERAVDSGLLDRFGFVDPTDGGDSHRYALNFEIAKPLGDWKLRRERLRARLPARSVLQLHLRHRHRTNGDQFEQFDDRKAYGAARGGPPRQPHRRAARAVAHRRRFALRRHRPRRTVSHRRSRAPHDHPRRRRAAPRPRLLCRTAGAGDGMAARDRGPASRPRGIRRRQRPRREQRLRERRASRAPNCRWCSVPGPTRSSSSTPAAAFTKTMRAARRSRVDPADGVTAADRVRPMVRASGARDRRAHGDPALHPARA